jgi:hypothetical protein
MKRALKVVLLILVLLVMAMMAGHDSAYLAVAGFVALSLLPAS